MSPPVEIESSLARLNRLCRRRANAEQKLLAARALYLHARTRKNALESEISRLSSEIELLEQGQLCLGDAIGGGNTMRAAS